MRPKRPAAGAAATLEVHVEGGLIRSTVQGRFTAADGDRLFGLIAQARAQSQVHCLLNDMRRAVPQVGPLQMNRHMLYLAADEAHATMKVAVVVGVRSSHYVYLEELALHHGLQLRVFTDGAQAEAWLLSPDATYAAAPSA